MCRHEIITEKKEGKMRCTYVELAVQMHTAGRGLCTFMMETLNPPLTDLPVFPQTFIQPLLHVLLWRALGVKIASSTIAPFLATALPWDGTFIKCQQGNLAFIRVGTAPCSADRVDSIRVIPTVLRRFNGLHFPLSCHPADLVFLRFSAPFPIPQLFFFHVSFAASSNFEEVTDSASAYPSMKYWNWLHYPWSLTELFLLKLWNSCYCFQNHAACIPVERQSPRQALVWMEVV